MTIIFDQSIACAKEIEKRFWNTGDLIESTTDERLGTTDLIFSSVRYRRAHISIVDARASKKVWMLHVTVFPHFNDPSPIYGIDIVAGPNKVSGAFHDFSISGDAESPMWLWFNAKTKVLEWNRPRELPEWAKQIFSPAMVAIGAVGPEELEEFIRLGLETLDFYLANVGLDQQDVADYHMAQNKYCRYQKQNPHTPRVLINLGFTEQEAKSFIHTKIFPEIS
jgi:phycocyanobilin:ferredoxin oxidoreductase